MHKSSSNIVTNKKVGDGKMTNEEHIKSLSGTDLIKKIREIAFCPVYRYVDWEKWLKSEDKHYPIVGRKGMHKSNQCYVEESVEVFGEPYYIIVQGQLVMKVPADDVKILE